MTGGFDFATGKPEQVSRYADTQVGMLHVRRILNRLKKKNRPTAPGEPKTEIVTQTPKSHNSIRGIPLLPNVVQDLISWKAVQHSDQQAAGEGYIDSGMIVTSPLGGDVEPRAFKDAYNQILTLARLQTASVLLEHALVSFPMDTSTHVLNEQKVESIAEAGVIQRGADCHPGGDSLPGYRNVPGKRLCVHSD